MFRAMFGLVGLLVCTAIILIAWVKYNVPVLKAGKQAQNQAAQIAGRAEDGRPAADTALFTGVEKPGGQLTGIKATKVDPTGPMSQHFGLIPGDVVVKVGVFDVGTTPLDDVSSTKEFIGADAYRANYDLVVERNGQRITLPADRNVGLPPAGQASAAATAPTTPTAVAPPPAQQPPAQPQGNPNHTARGAAGDLIDQIKRDQNRGE